MKNIKKEFYIFGAENGNGLKKYKTDEIDMAIMDFLKADTKEYVSLGIEFTGSQFQYGVSSCDLFSKKDGVKKINQDYKSFYNGNLLKYTEQLINIINLAIKA